MVAMAQNASPEFFKDILTSNQKPKLVKPDPKKPVPHPYYTLDMLHEATIKRITQLVETKGIGFIDYLLITSDVSLQDSSYFQKIADTITGQWALLADQMYYMMSNK